MLRVVDVPADCAADGTSLSWNITGEPGPIGPQGPAGPVVPDSRFGNDTGGAGAGVGDTCTIGEVMLTAAFVSGGLPAGGRILPISELETLFVQLGTTYGGDGERTFALPDLRSAAPNGLTYSICWTGSFPQGS